MSGATHELVVVGASAGGVEALLSVFERLPRGYRPSIACVLHLPEKRPSLLAELFGRRLAMPVREARDKEPLQPGTLYVAGPDYHLSVEREGCFSLSGEAPLHFSRPAIDFLFASAADAYGERLIGVLLTGASQDGAAGLARIHRQGGLSIVQDPDEAQVPTMPEAALALHTPDHILRLRDIAALLAKLDDRPC
ncbi:chemotaxis protein CheB [Pseudomonas sp. LRF_L74]|uniref:chemotaxis protein CheB n=1 Tax=Pseudomonas sp. LRF_L74 TaxID=3369422 RepID=UPI003F5D6FBF